MKHDPILPNLVDELGALRVEIRRLKAREAALEDALMALSRQTAGPLIGHRFMALARSQSTRRFDHTRLQSDLAAQKHCWVTQRSQVLTCRPLTADTRPMAPAGRTAMGDPP